MPANKDILDRIITSIQPFSESANKYVVNENEKKFIEKLVSAMILQGTEENLNIDRRSNGVMNFKYKRAQFGRVNFRTEQVQMQIIYPDKVCWFEDLSVDECMDNIQLWIEYIEYIMKVEKQGHL